MRSTIVLIALGASAIAFSNDDHSSQHRRLARAAKSSSAVLEGSLTSDEGCSAFYTPKKAISVAALLKKTSLTEAGLRNANPSLKKVAPAGKSVCAAGPTNLQFGSTDLDGGCTEFVEVKSGDTCIKIADAHNVSLDSFLALNPGAGEDCLSLWLGYSECLVGGGLTESTVNSTDSTAILDQVKHEHVVNATSTHHSSSHHMSSSHHRASTSHARIHTTTRTTHTTHRTTHAASKAKETHKAAAKKEKAESEDDDDDEDSSVKVKVSSSSSLSTGKVTFYVRLPLPDVIDARRAKATAASTARTRLAAPQVTIR